MLCCCELEQKQIQLIKLNDEHILSADIECTDGQTIEAKNSLSTCKSTFRLIEGKLLILLAGVKFLLYDSMKLGNRTKSNLRGTVLHRIT